MSTSQSQPTSLSNEQWEQFRNSFDVWRAQSSASDQALFQQPIDDKATRAALQRIFLNHPVYRNLTVREALFLLRREARDAIAACRVLQAKPAPFTPDEQSHLLQLDAVWSQFGGSNWSQVDFAELAEKRLGFEFARDHGHTRPRIADNEGAIEDLQKGCGCLFLGLLVTGGTYLVARDGGTYIVAWGAVAWGLIMVLLALLRIFSQRVRSK
ncbi:MAG: hypothetical protein ACRDJW_18100 [Thermomicrobiales bacterium]